MIFCSVLAGIFAAGCSNPAEHQPATDEDGAMRFSVIHPGQTRATDEGFETGDKIGVWVADYDEATPLPLQISGNRANNVPVRYDGTVWTPARSIYWGETAVDVFAYYPFIETPSSIETCDFAVRTDQNSPVEGWSSGYAASDFLWAKAANVASGTVPLQFKHLMSKLQVVIQRGTGYEAELPDEITVYLHSTVPSAIVDLSIGSASKNSTGTARTITCKKVSKDTFTAIVVPQRIDTVRPFVEIVMGGVSYLFEGTFNYRPGTVHTFTMIVTSPPGKIMIDIGGQIDGTWN
jgi:hypothetical protein